MPMPHLRWLSPDPQPGVPACPRLTIQRNRIFKQFLKKTFLHVCSTTDSYAQRAAVYKALAKDNDWQERFLIPNLPFIDKQESEITYLVPWCKLGTPPKEGESVSGTVNFLTEIVHVLSSSVLWD